MTLRPRGESIAQCSDIEGTEMNSTRTLPFDHRDAVGGMWEQIGRLQFEFLRNHGLTPNMKLLDIGCGAFRGGVHFVSFLDAGNYYAVDADERLIEDGYNIEICNAGLQWKLPRLNLLVSRRFEFSLFKQTFDVAIAQSVFTHIPLNDIRVCLAELAKSVRPGGKFFASILECPHDYSYTAPMKHEPGGVISFPADDPFHYRLEDFKWAENHLPWAFSYIGDWAHPRDAKMICFTRVPD